MSIYKLKSDIDIYIKYQIFLYNQYSNFKFAINRENVSYISHLASLKFAMIKFSQFLICMTSMSLEQEMEISKFSNIK